MWLHYFKYKTLTLDLQFCEKTHVQTQRDKIQTIYSKL